MALRLGGLADLDPAAVPLPAGTEVVTRVERVVDGEVRPGGATGRVVTWEGERVEVVFLDGRRATYLREELTPRKLGVARYAQRRQAAWDQLHECIAIDTLVGSRAWGVADEGSDEDRRGVFVLPAPWTTGLAEPPLDLVSLDGSQTYWELGKAIRQALRADPNTLEMLFANPTVVDPIGSRSSTGSSSTTAPTSSRRRCATRSRATATSSSACSAISCSAATRGCSRRRAWSSNHSRDSSRPQDAS